MVEGLLKVRGVHRVILYPTHVHVELHYTRNRFEGRRSKKTKKSMAQRVAAMFSRNLLS